MSDEQPTISKVKAHQQEVIRRRKIVRRAFDLVRYDSRHVVSRGRLLAALGGRSEMSEGIVGLAERLLSLPAGYPRS